MMIKQLKSVEEHYEDARYGVMAIYSVDIPDSEKARYVVCSN